MKKYTKTIISIALLVSLSLSATIPISALSHIKGDTDCDGEVNIIDATKIQRVIAEIISDDDGSIHRYGDIDGDGFSIMDATQIQYYLAQCRNTYHIGEVFECIILSEPMYGD